MDGVTVELWHDGLSHVSIDTKKWLEGMTDQDEISEALAYTFEQYAESKRGWNEYAEPEKFLQEFGSDLDMGNDEYGCFSGYTGNYDTDYDNDFIFHVWYMEFPVSEYYLFLQWGMWRSSDVEVYHIVDIDSFHNSQVQLGCQECQHNGWESTWQYNSQWEKRFDGSKLADSSLVQFRNIWYADKHSQQKIREKLDTLENRSTALNSHQVEIETDGEWQPYNENIHEHEYDSNNVRFRCPDCGNMSVYPWFAMEAC